MHRLFVGLALPAPLVATCRRAAADAPPGWAPIDDSLMHVTLRFIGEVDTPRADDIAAQLETLDAPPLDLAIAGVGWFDHGPRGVLFARVEPRDALDQLHRKIDRLVQCCGVAAEGRAYHPHVTLARRRSSACPPDVWLADWVGLASEPAAVRAVTLFESRLGHGGPSYETILRRHLRPR